MNQYVRDFQVHTIKTYLANDVLNCKKFLLNEDSLDFKLFHCNIRSLNENIDELNVVLNNLNEDFHCIVLSETWQIRDTSMFNIAGYYPLLYNEGTINQNDQNEN